MTPNPVSRTLSIALLIADTPAKPVLESKGDYLAIYTTWLQRSLKSIKRHHWQDKFTLDIRPFDVIKGQYPSDGQLKDGLWDAVMITGSASTVYGDVPWIKKLSDWIVDLAEQHPLVRICGYCWGHQLIAQAFGGKVIENPEGWELGVYDCELTEDGEEVFGFTKWDLKEESAGGKLQEVSENGEAESETKSVRLQQVHKDTVVEMPDDFNGSAFLKLASTPKCSIHSLALKYATDSPPIPSIAGTSDFIAFDTYSTPTSSGPSPPRGLQILTLQGHPEFTTEIVEMLIEAKTEMGTAPEDIKEDAFKRAKREDDALKVGRRVLCMLGVEEAREEGGDSM